MKNTKNKSKYPNKYKVKEKFRKFDKNRDVRNVKDQLSNSNTYAYKKFGQNFLLDTEHVDFMINGLNIVDNDFIIEIGPGMGALTQRLIDKIGIKNYLAIEIDQEKVNHLVNEFEGINIKNISILEFNIEEYCKENNISSYKVIGSLPFNISKKIIQKFSDTPIQAKRAVFMVQKEVGEDLIAYEHSTFLSIYLSQYWKVLSTSIIPSRAFFPQPKVDGMVLVLDPNNTDVDLKFIKFVKRGFTQPRKKIGNVLVLNKDYNLYNNRAHELTIEQWKNLYLDVKRV